MSILYQHDDCILLSHRHKLNDVYLAAVDEGHHNIAAFTFDNPNRIGHLKTFEINRKLFAINTVYVRDQQTPSPSDPPDEASDEPASASAKRSRKRRRPAKPVATDHSADVALVDDMQKVVSFVLVRL